MTETAGAAAPRRRRLRVRRILLGALGLVVAGAFADLLGWDISGWFSQLWDSITGISVEYVVAGITAGTIQTTLTAFGWWSILVYGFPDAPIPWRQAWATYAVAVALNGIVPANLGTIVMMLMFTTLIAGATFAAVLGGFAVQKIFFCVIGSVPYLYLFFTVAGSFDIKFEFVHENPWALALLLVGAAALIAMLVHAFWPRVVRWWHQAKAGGAILGHPGAYLLRVALPSAGSWIAMLCVISAFLAAYGIPVTFDTLMHVVAGNSLANVTSATPGGVGVTQAFNVASLNGVASSADATAYSVTQQVIMTAWNILLAIMLVGWAFGWRSGKELVERSYGEAKEKAAEQREARRARRQAGGASA